MSKKLLFLRPKLLNKKRSQKAVRKSGGGADAKNDLTQSRFRNLSGIFVF